MYVNMFNQLLHRQTNDKTQSHKLTQCSHNKTQCKIIIVPRELKMMSVFSKGKT